MCNYREILAAPRPADSDWPTPVGPPYWEMALLGVLCAFMLIWFAIHLYGRG
jgi:hypothetical protein